MSLGPIGPPTAAALAGVSKHYKVRLAAGRSGVLRAVDNVDISIPAGRTVGLVGESGSGKSTVARLLLRLIDPTEGHVFLDGVDITRFHGRELRRTRARMQLVFQDPYSSFDPRSTIDDSLLEALRNSDIDRRAKRERCAVLLDTVGLPPSLGQRHPRDLSGGQLQRAAIARALAVDPALIALDEPVSSLDVSSQVHIVDLLQKLQSEVGVSMLFISHDLSVVRDVSHEIAVMYLGKIVETAPAERIYEDPQHPYTQALLASAPRLAAASAPKGQRVVLAHDVPSPLHPPAGCRFHTRCPVAVAECSEVPPVLCTPVGDQSGSARLVACHLRSGVLHRVTDAHGHDAAGRRWTAG